MRRGRRIGILGRAPEGPSYGNRRHGLGGHRLRDLPRAPRRARRGGRRTRAGAARVRPHAARGALHDASRRALGRPALLGRPARRRAAVAAGRAPLHRARGAPLRRRLGRPARAARARPAAARAPRVQRRGLAGDADAGALGAARAPLRRRRAPEAAAAALSPARGPLGALGVAGGGRRAVAVGPDAPRPPRGRSAACAKGRRRRSRPRAPTRCSWAAPCSTCSRARRATARASRSPAARTPTGRSARSRSPSRARCATPRAPGAHTSNGCPRV